jgi:hypothetical protein
MAPLGLHPPRFAQWCLVAGSATNALPDESGQAAQQSPTAARDLTALGEAGTTTTKVSEEENVTIEIEIEDLTKLLTKQAATELAEDFTIYEHLLDRRVLIRTRISGVSIGILEDCTPTAARLTKAIRIWSWEDAFTVSEIATTGAACRIAHHPDGIVIDSPDGRELMLVETAAWERIMASAVVGKQ